jgi:dTDP-4-dehydrorhamnose reductase
VQIIAPDRKVLDLAQVDIIKSVLALIKPDAIINAAAYTAVDKAESDELAAYNINGYAVEVIAAYARHRGIPFVHISTDFVFDGESSVPYSVRAKPNPLSVYGQSKYLGECLAIKANPHSVIVRTGWVYCEHGNNFVKTMISLAQRKTAFGVVNDQVGTPTYAINLATFLWEMLQNNTSNGIYHYADDGVATWHEFAVAIFDEAIKLGLIDSLPDVKAIGTIDYPLPAKRPKYSVLKVGGEDRPLEVMHWHQALQLMLSKLPANPSA